MFAGVAIGVAPKSEFLGPVTTGDLLHVSEIIIV
jgi:hypothetical protein